MPPGGGGWGGWGAAHPAAVDVEPTKVVAAHSTIVSDTRYSPGGRYTVARRLAPTEPRRLSTAAWIAAVASSRWPLPSSGLAPKDAADTQLPPCLVASYHVPHWWRGRAGAATSSGRRVRHAISMYIHCVRNSSGSRRRAHQPQPAPLPATCGLF
jgi:hypothetical protein